MYEQVLLIASAIAFLLSYTRVGTKVNMLAVGLFFLALSILI